MPRGRPLGYKKVGGTWKQLDTPTSTPTLAPTSTQVGPSSASKPTPTPNASTDQVKLQRCVVCYNEYRPFYMPSDEWESSKMKMFYHILNIGGPGTGGPSTSDQGQGGKSSHTLNGDGSGPGNDENSSSDDEDNDEDMIISLPFCAYCASRVSVMYSLHCQMQDTLSRFDSIRDDVAFAVCETISKNNKNGPMDYIREKIFQIWNPRYVELKDAGKLADGRGLNSIANEYSKGKFHFDKKMLSHRALDTSFDTPTNSGRSHPKRASLNDSSLMVNDHNDQDLRVVAVVANDISQSKKIRKKRGTSAAKVHNASGSGYAAVESMLEMQIYNQSSYVEGGQEEGEILYSNNLTLAPNQIHTYHGNSTLKKLDSKNGSTSPPRMPKLRLMSKIASPAKQKRLRTKTGYFEYVPVTATEPEPLPTPGSKRKRVQKKAFNIGGESPKLCNSIRTKKQIESKNVQQELVPTNNFNVSENTEYDNFDDDDDSSLMIDETLPSENANTIISRKSKKESHHSVVAGVYKCKLCSRSYFELSRLKRHESIVHPSSQNWRCKYCPKCFSSQLTLRRHVQLIHHQMIAGSIKCSYCKKTFVKHLAYVQHIETVHPDKETDTNIPSQSNNSLLKKIKMEMKSPTKEVMSNNFDHMMMGEENSEVDLDQASYFDGDLDDEELINNGTNVDTLSTFTCDVCGVSFQFKGILDLHKAAHFKRNNPMQCNDCGRVFSKDQDFKKHLTVAHKKRIKCNVINCKAFYYRAEKLAKHIETKHSNTNVGTKGSPKGRQLALEWKSEAQMKNNVQDATFKGNTTTSTGEIEDFKEDSLDSSEKSLYIDDN